VCSPSLSEGMSAPKAVGPPLVEKDWVLRGYVLFTDREGGGPFHLDLRNLRFRRSGTFRLEGMRCIVMPCLVGSTWRGPFEASHLGLLFGS
jgi:hypothetical protein